MASNYWLKLFHETIYDPKIMMRSPSARLRWYECLCLAGDYDRDGELPPIESMVYVFRISEDQLKKELVELVDTGLFTFENNIYYITNWRSRQAAMKPVERTSRMRRNEKKQEYYEPVTEVKRECNEVVTNRHTDIDKDIEEIKINKKNKPSSAKSADGEVIIPDSLNTNEFIGAWNEWIEYRKQIKKKLTPITQKKQLQKLSLVGSIKAIEQIDQSISKGWQGLFEVQNSTTELKMGLRN
jgi:hypothetical protein